MEGVLLQSSYGQEHDGRCLGKQLSGDWELSCLGAKDGQQLGGGREGLMRGTDQADGRGPEL